MKKSVSQSVSRTTCWTLCSVTRKQELFSETLTHTVQSVGACSLSVLQHVSREQGASVRVSITANQPEGTPRLSANRCQGSSALSQWGAEEGESRSTWSRTEEENSEEQDILGTVGGGEGEGEKGWKNEENVAKKKMKKERKLFLFSDMSHVSRFRKCSIFVHFYTQVSGSFWSLQTKTRHSFILINKLKKSLCSFKMWRNRNKNITFFT